MEQIKIEHTRLMSNKKNLLLKGCLINKNKIIMHFVLTYDLAAEGLRRTEIESKILEILNPYKHVKRLSTFYIVHISSGAEWNTIWKQLSNLSQNIPDIQSYIRTWAHLLQDSSYFISLQTS